MARGQALVWIALALTAIGVLMIYSASTFWGSAKFDDPAYFLKRQVLGAALGVAGFVACARIPHRRWIAGAPWLLAGACALLVLVLLAGSRFNGARRWLRFGGIGFQPSELGKLAAVVWAAAFAARAGDRIREFGRGFLPAVLPIAVLGALTLLEPDFGTALFLGALGVTVLILGGLRVTHLAATVGSLVPLVTLAMVTRFDYIRERLRFFTEDGVSYQVQQSFIALGSGGLAGRGIGAGAGKLFFLPEVAGDFIFPAIGEEIGYLGVAVVVGLFMAFVWCGYRVAREALPRSRFGFLLAMGLTTWIGLQGATNLAVVSGSVPTKGIALPFISYGSSSLVVCLVATGILVSVARDCAPGGRAAARAEGGTP